MPNMASVAFDTFQAVRALESAGVERTQAEAIVETIRHDQDYATKSDLARLETDMRARIDKLGAQLRANMSALQTRLTRRMYGIAIGLGGLTAAFELLT